MSIRNELYVAIIAVVILVGGYICIWAGHDGEIKALMGLVVGFYFGRFLPSPEETSQK